MPKRSFALRLNLWLLQFTRNWLRIALVVIGVYAGLPWVAPTLMHLGWETPARVLYFAYSPFCHQFAFRSLFLFGDQIAYPRAVAGGDLTPFEAYVVGSPEWEQAIGNHTGIPGRSTFRTPQEVDLSLWTYELQFGARDFVGNSEMGYKMTLCARDVAIYSMVFMGGLLYSIPFVRRRLRPVPIWLYVFLGLGPIGIDGFSQLLSYPPFNLWEPRETLPIYRVVTGAIFGLMNAWLAFPYLEQAMLETRRDLESKLREANILSP